jgi:glutamine amidotransferase
VTGWGTSALVDYGMGNLDSVQRALEVAGATVRVTADPADLAAADRIVLPGVGAFGVAMANLRDRGLDEALTTEVIDKGAPFLGICLGMQLMATSSAEHGEHRGLGWVDARVERLEPSAGERVPHVGWNEVDPISDHPLLAGIEPGHDCYFVHSYAMRCAHDADVVATTPYAGGFTSVVARGTACGMQFHPEKSQRVGKAILANFVRWDG